MSVFLSASTRCRVRDLLCTDNSCDPEDQMSDDGTFTACSEDGNLCVMSNSERARYNFSVSYCLLNGSLERKCEEDILEWTGSIPFLIDGKKCPHATLYTCICVISACPSHTSIK